MKSYSCYQLCTLGLCEQQKETQRQAKRVTGSCLDINGGRLGMHAHMHLNGRKCDMYCMYSISISHVGEP